MKYKYKVLCAIDDSDIEKCLNQHGARGYRVVEAFPEVDDDDETLSGWTVVFEKAVRG